MKCAHCGANLKLTDEYCPYCGRKNTQSSQHVKEKKYAEPKKQPGMMGSMNMMMYMSTAMIAIFDINWPLGMSFYWLVNSIVRVGQNLLINKCFIKD